MLNLNNERDDDEDGPVPFVVELNSIIVERSRRRCDGAGGGLSGEQGEEWVEVYCYSDDMMLTEGASGKYSHSL